MTDCVWNAHRTAPRRAFVLLPLVVCLWLFCWGATPAQAQSCWYGGLSHIDFGELSNSSHSDGTASISITCQGAQDPATFKVCLMIPGYPSAGDVATRYLINNNNNDNPRQTPFNLYSDPARTQIIGPPPTGGGYTLYEVNHSVPGNWSQATHTFTVYGRAPAVSNSQPAGRYVANINNPGPSIRWAAPSGGTPPADCFQSPGGNIDYHLDVEGDLPTGCSVEIGDVTDLDFGSTTQLNTVIDGQSSITMNCPPNSAWSLGLNNGQNALSGQRRMTGPLGNHVNYELYMDSARTVRWDDIGGDVASGGIGQGAVTLQVYGRVPAGQGDKAAGSYSDTITITLSY